MVNLKWQPSFSASALRAAQAGVQSNPVIDKALIQTLKPAALELDSILGEWLGANAPRGWRLLIGIASDVENNHLLAEQWMSRFGLLAVKNSSHIHRLAGAISDIEAATHLHAPKLSEQLILRGRPIQEQWTGYGQGLMAHVRRLTDPNWLVAEAQAVLVQPIYGGAGLAFPTMNRIAIEAVLTNPLAELPEVVRVAWLVSQLQADLPSYTEGLAAGRAESVVALACLIATLAAAEVVELSRCEESTIQLAIEHWQVAIPARDDIIGILVPWWETYLQTRPAWPIALKALDRMLIGQLV